ncbi:uncharacterized protein LOC123509535 isoform X2 [Portunus trituberculatus]|uniref:uncharacterized protein LOC123509535 isoform X2 n=1 Tax=Portunus trituberculatus TaxID=210409 RepID=UPI001E1CCD5F|nr:uncharacterized protein LOC123509535 isoform X2 [Portunus trituberculatus]
MADINTIQQTDPEIVPVPEQTQDGVPPVCKSRLFTWRLLGAVLALLVVLGWVFIIVMLILEEKWQLVLVAWLLLYSAAHFCYWYCKRHSLLSLRRQSHVSAEQNSTPLAYAALLRMKIRLRVLTRIGESSEKVDDTPPTYDEVMDTEAPPPAYFTVVEETRKASGSSSSLDSTSFPAMGVATVSGMVHQDAAATEAKEYLQRPPAYQTPRHMRKISPRILPGVHQLRAPTDSAVTATAAATAIATVAAAVTATTPTQVVDETEALEEDPIRGPIVRHLRSTTIATLDVSSTEDVTPSVTRSAAGHDDEEIDLQAPTTAIPGFP